MTREIGTVAILGEDALFRHALRDLLRDAGMRVVAEASDVADDGAAATEAPVDVVVAILARHGTPVGRAVRRLREAAPKARILLVAGSVVPADVVEALRAGACGYVLKDEPPERIAAAVRAAMEGEAPLSPAAAAVVVEQLRAAPGADGAGPELTPRERHVLERLAAGRRNGEIAEELEISVYTVKRHVSHLLTKLGVENRTRAAVEATRRGLL